MDETRKAELLRQAKANRAKRVSAPSSGIVQKNQPAKVTPKQPAKSNQRNVEFPKESGWTQFWYSCAGLNFAGCGLLVVVTFLPEGPSFADVFPYSAAMFANGLLLCFFGYMTQLAVHVRWLLAEQLRGQKD